jgi:sigma-54 specific flagellar transcriptional regulator A
LKKRADVRIIAATNKNLQRAIDNREFREDLFYRLDVLEMEIPPLRKRKEDIKELIKENNHLLKGKKVSKDFCDAICDYDWPGNVRELITFLKRIGIELNSPINGKKVKELLRQKKYKKSFEIHMEKIQDIWRLMKAGIDFWQAVKDPYLDRDLNRDEVKAIIAQGLEETNFIYKDLLKVFNLKSRDYHRLMRFLHDQDLKPKPEIE